MGVELRRFPRIARGDDAQLEVPARASAPERGWVTVPVIVRTVSCQGAGVDMAAGAATHVVPGTEVHLTMQIDGREVELPGRVVWAAGAHVGIRLRLGKADDAVRKAYAHFIIPLTNEAIERLRG